MLAKLIVDITNIDISKVEIPKEELLRYIPQRFEFEQLDGVIKVDLQQQYAIGFKKLKPDEFWVRGHIPGRPIMPGVLMIEGAAQLCSFFYSYTLKKDKDVFLGYGAINNVRFRAPAVPADIIYYVAKNKKLTSRVAIFQTQAIVNNKIIFEGEITGIPL